MFRRLVLLLTLVALFSTAAEAVIVGRGRRGRSYLRHVTYVQKLQNDKREIYNEYGFPVHRHREYAYGEIREFWTYYEHGLEFQPRGDEQVLAGEQAGENRSLSRLLGYGDFGRVKMAEHLSRVPGAYRRALGETDGPPVWFPMIPDTGRKGICAFETPLSALFGPPRISQPVT
jgi:hypothetical protein